MIIDIPVVKADQAIITIKLLKDGSDVVSNSEMHIKKNVTPLEIGQAISTFFPRLLELAFNDYLEAHGQ